jgi:hypothetical protein
MAFHRFDQYALSNLAVRPHKSLPEIRVVEGSAVEIFPAVLSPVAERVYTVACHVTRVCPYDHLAHRMKTLLLWRQGKCIDARLKLHPIPRSTTNARGRVFEHNAFPANRVYVNEYGAVAAFPSSWIQRAIGVDDEGILHDPWHNVYRSRSMVRQPGTCADMSALNTRPCAEYRRCRSSWTMT